MMVCGDFLLGKKVKICKKFVFIRKLVCLLDEILCNQ